MVLLCPRLVLPALPVFLGLALSAAPLSAAAPPASASCASSRSAMSPISTSSSPRREG